MKKTDKLKKEQPPQGRAPRQPKGVTVLTDQELEQVQGGRKAGEDPPSENFTFQK